jgi:penicillin-binding protein 1C
MNRRVVLAGVGFLALELLVLWALDGPLPEGLLDTTRFVSTEVVDRRGRPLYESLSASSGRTRWLAAERLPQCLVDATLAAEDRRFFEHKGVDPRSLLRACWRNLRAGRLVQGGSTLTQQTVKLLMNRERTLAGKLEEIVQALRLERRLGKREILALYLSLAPYGNQLQGAEAASRAYFGCAAENLTFAQAALLAGLPQRPSVLNPYRNFEGALARQRWVLARMRQNGALSPMDYERALGETLRLVRDPRPVLAPHFVERVLEGLPAGSARRVETTLDAALQGEVRGILATHRARLLEHGARNVAVAVLANRAGEWLAWEGSGDWAGADGGAIDGVVSPRQPGSALKPFTYALAFERGFTPASVLPDIPLHFPTAVDGVLYAPRNYDGSFRGPLRARDALAGSQNVPAVWTLSRLGVPDLLRLLKRAGLTSLDKTADHYGLALTMGDAEVRLDELVSAYATIARGGLYKKPRSVRRVSWADGSFTGTEPVAGERILSPRAAFWVADVLQDPRARAYAFGTGGSLDFPFPVAVKTGTSTAYRDNWTLAFTRDVTVGVWVGNFDRSALRDSSGVTGAAPILHDVLLAAQKHVTGRLPLRGGAELLDPPGDLSPRSICALSGLDAAAHCPRLETEWLSASGRRTACTWHRHAGPRKVVDWPAEYRAWAKERGLLREAPPAPERPPLARVSTDDRPTALRISNPASGAVYMRDPTLREDYQTLPLRAVAEARAQLTWLVDGRRVGSAGAEGAVQWPLQEGAHTIAVVDERGRYDQATIVVK